VSSRRLALCACALFWGCTSTIERPHPDLATQLPAGRSIAIMPVESAAINISPNGEVDSLDLEAATAARKVVEAVQRHLAARGRTVSIAPLDEAPFQRDPDSRFFLTELQVAADTAMARLLRTQTPEKREEYLGVRSVLGALAPIARATGADALLFICSSLVVDRYLPGSPSYRAEVEVLLIDASTGETLYAGDAKRSGWLGDVAALTVAALGSI
jgi:hypothetical protein